MSLMVRVHLICILLNDIFSEQKLIPSCVNDINFVFSFMFLMVLRLRILVPFVQFVVEIIGIE